MIDLKSNSIPNEVKEYFAKNKLEQVFEFYWDQRYRNSNKQAHELNLRVKKWLAKIEPWDLIRAWYYCHMQIELPDSMESHPFVKPIMEMVKKFKQESDIKSNVN